MKKLLVLCLLSVFSCQSFANDMYVGTEYVLLDLDFSGRFFQADANPSAINFIIGKEMTENLSIESSLGLKLGDDRPTGHNFDIELDQLFSINAIFKAPIGGAAVFGRAGLAAISYEDSDGDEADGSGISLGAGAEFNISESSRLTLQYLLYPDAEYDNFAIDIESSSINIGFAASF